MSDALTLFARAARLAEAAANDVTLNLRAGGVDIRVQGRRDVLWPGLPASSETISWAQLEEQPHGLGEAINALDAHITTLRAERLQKELS